MKRLLLCAAIALAVSLVLAPVALASVGAHRTQGSALARPLGSLSRARAFAPVGDTGPYNISGHVLDFGGNPVQGAEVDWGFFDPMGLYTPGGYVDTGADGSFAFPGVSGGHTFNAAASDDLDVYYPANPAGLLYMIDWSLDFATHNDATPFSYETRPGEANVTVANWPYNDIGVWAGDVNTGYASSDVPLTSGAGAASVLPMTNFDDLVAYGNFVYYSSARYDYCPVNAEWLGTPTTVTGGGTAASTVALDMDSGVQGAWLAGPVCRHSGAAGRTVTMQLYHWPSGEKADFEAWYGTGLSTNMWYSTTKTSSNGAATYNVPLKIYAHAPVGVYEIDATSDSTLALMWDLYQVTAFKASASSILHGHAVHLSGKVPGSGTATLYAITRSVSAQPASLTPSGGWHRVGSYKIRSGKFTTAVLHPKRTTWYVVKYKGSAFWAYTQIVKVRVH